MSGKSDSPFKTVIHSNNFGGPGDASRVAPVLPPTAGPARPSGPFATHNSSFNTELGPFASQNSAHNQTSFRTLIDEAPQMNSMGPGAASQRSQIPQSAPQVGPFHSQGSAGFAPPPLQTMPPGGNMGSMGPMGAMTSAQHGPPQAPPPVDSNIGVHCTVVVSKLLDVPVESGLFVKDAKTYQLRVFDHKRKELARSEQIQGLDDSQLQGLTAQTFSIPEELGTLHAKTLSKTIQVQAGLLCSRRFSGEQFLIDLRATIWAQQQQLDVAVRCRSDSAVLKCFKCSLVSALQPSPKLLERLPVLAACWGAGAYIRCSVVL